MKFKLFVLLVTVLATVALWGFHGGTDPESEEDKYELYLVWCGGHQDWIQLCRDGNDACTPRACGQN